MRLQWFLRSGFVAKWSEAAVNGTLCHKMSEHSCTEKLGDGAQFSRDLDQMPRCIS